MIKKKTLLFILILFLLASCGNTLSSVKRGLTGEKENTTDEFLVQKKDPLILPPDFEQLPTPDERTAATEEVSIFKKNSKKTISTEEILPADTSTEESILKKIQQQ